MRLGAKQELFATYHPKLLTKAHSLGWDVRLGELLRFQAQCDWNAEHCRVCKQHRITLEHRLTAPHGGHTFVAIGIKHSVHRLKLAQDVILCENGAPRWDTDAYSKLGIWWEEQHELARWGGRFRDPGHFSFTHRGIR